MKDKTIVSNLNLSNGIQQPVYEGRYQIGDGSLNVSFSIGKKPHYIHRWFCKWCLGWKWIDN